MNNKPDLWVSNTFAWELFQRLSGQVIVAGMGEPLGIKFEAIGFIFDLYGIHDDTEKIELFEKITLIDSVRLKYKRDELIRQQQQPKAKAGKR